MSVVDLNDPWTDDKLDRGKFATILTRVVSNEVEPLVLTVNGKWGSGKTYLVEHDLKDAVKDSCIILKVSLFGITETESVHHAVKESWVDAWLSEIDAKHIADTGNKMIPA